MTGYEYKAFITYSHNDADAAARLGRALESYRVPSRLVGRDGTNGQIGRRLGKVFRDREEMPAGANLSKTLIDALRRSENLVVVCSPAARDSRWVNIEISEFLKTHDSSKVFCYVVDGIPMAGDDPAQAHLECFPRALGYLESDAGGPVTVEAVAADIRDEADGEKLARLKIISGLLGVGLDELVQRDTQRRHRTMMAVTAASALGMLVMSALTYVAVDARQGEEMRRAEAEDLIEFMLSDLRDRLDAVGRLDVLDAVGEKAIEYYSTMELSQHSEPSLGRRARAFHLLGEVDDLKGEMQSARDAFINAYESTAALLRRAPGDGERIYNHAQSVFWVGYLDWRLGNLAGAETAFREYVTLSEQLAAIDPDNQEWNAEFGHSHNNMGIYYYELGDFDKADEHLRIGLSVFDELSRTGSADGEWQSVRAQSLAWLADVNEDAGRLAVAKEFRIAQAAVYQSLLADTPNDEDSNQDLMIAHSALADIALAEGDLGLAIENLGLAREIAARLTGLDPENTFFAHMSIKLDAVLTEVMLYRGETDAASVLLGGAIVDMARLRAHDASVVEWTTTDNSLQILNGTILRLTGRADAGLVVLQSTIRALEALSTDYPDNMEIRQLLALAHSEAGRTHAALGNEEESLANAEKIIATLRPLSDKLPLRFVSVLGNAYQLTGNTNDAVAADRQLAAAGYRHPARFERRALSSE